MATINKIPKCPPLRFPDFNDDWQKTTLGTYFKIQGGYAFKSEYYEPFGIPIIRISNLPMNGMYVDLSDCVWYPQKINIDNQFKVQKGDLLIAMSGATTGKTGIYNENKSAYLNQRVGLFRPISIDVFYPILYAYVESDSFKLALDKLLIAGAQPNISPSDIEGIPICLPQLAEQKKIADFLSLIDERIQSCSETIAQRKSFRNGIIKLIVGNLKADRISLKECVICNTSSLSESKLDVIGIPVYGASGIVGYTSVVEADQCAILIIKDGSGVGRLKYIDSPHSFTGTLNSLKSKNSNVNLRYVYYCMSTLDLKKYSTGTGIPHIYFKDYGLESIPLPSLEEQKKIADFLSLVDERIEVEEQLLQQYEKQKRYLLKQMFV